MCDWANDEQPYPMKVPRGELHALPITLPLDDVHALWDRRMDIDRYGRTIRETFDTLYREGADNGRLLVLYLHPWLIGQPFRIRYLDAALDHIVRGRECGPRAARKSSTSTAALARSDHRAARQRSPDRSSPSLSLTGAGLSRPLGIPAMHLNYYLAQEGGADEKRRLGGDSLDQRERSCRPPGAASRSSGTTRSRASSPFAMPQENDETAHLQSPRQVKSAWEVPRVRQVVPPSLRLHPVRVRPAGGAFAGASARAWARFMMPSRGCRRDWLRCGEDLEPEL